MLNFCNASLHLSFCCEICNVNWLWLLRKTQAPLPPPLSPLLCSLASWWALVPVPTHGQKTMSRFDVDYDAARRSSHLFHQIHRIIFTSIVEPTHNRFTPVAASPLPPSFFSYLIYRMCYYDFQRAHAFICVWKMTHFRINMDNNFYCHFYC